MKREEFNLEEIEKKAIEQFKTGESLFGSDGAFAPLLQRFIEKALEAEMEAHLDEAERLEGNKRNGKGKKTIKRDRKSTRLNSSHVAISYAVFCLKKTNNNL